jgi:hypothetical protein
MRGIFNVGILALCLGALASLCSYWLRKQDIARFARSVTKDCRSQRDAAFALARVIFTEVRRVVPDPVFISRILAPLGASPVSVLKQGGCCSGTHRLFITSLDTIGIRAAQITVFRAANPAAAHCLAQVTTETENLLIDVDYGVWYKHPRGGSMDLLALRSGVTPVIERFATGEARFANSSRTRTAGYPTNAYYHFDFILTRTANWADNAWKPALYAVLHRLTRGRVDCLLLPPLLEWPEVLLSAAFSLVGLVLLGAESVAALI